MSIQAELSDVQRHAIALMVQGVRQVDVAAQVDVAPETLSRWKHDAVFVAALNTARAELWAEHTTGMLALVGEARQRLGALVQSEDESVALRAAMAVLKTVEAPKGPTTRSGVEREQLISSF